MNSWSTGDFWSNETILNDTVMVNSCQLHLSEPRECTTPRVNPCVNYGLEGITVYQCRFIVHNQCSTPAGNADNLEIMGSGAFWKSMNLPLNFAVKLTLLLKNSL